WPAVAVFDADPEGGVRVVQRPHPIDRRGGLAVDRRAGLAVAQHASVSQCLRDVPVVVAPGHPVAGVTARTGDLADPCAFDAVGAEDLRRLLDDVAHRSSPRSRNSSSTASPATCAHSPSLMPLATMRGAPLAATPRASSAASAATGSTSVTSSSWNRPLSPGTSHPVLAGCRSPSTQEPSRTTRAC